MSYPVPRQVADDLRQQGTGKEESVEDMVTVEALFAEESLKVKPVDAKYRQHPETRGSSEIWITGISLAFIL